MAKFSSDGSTMLCSAYLPGTHRSSAPSIAVDAWEGACVTGKVGPEHLEHDHLSVHRQRLPAVVHALGPDAMLTVLDPTGSSLVYSSFLGDSPRTDSGSLLARAGHRVRDRHHQLHRVPRGERHRVPLMADRHLCDQVRHRPERTGQRGLFPPGRGLGGRPVPRCIGSQCGYRQQYLRDGWCLLRASPFP